jgi:hypothetical protein
VEDSIFVIFFTNFSVHHSGKYILEKTFSVKKKHIFPTFWQIIFLQNNKINKLHTSFCFFFQLSAVASLVSIPKKHFNLNFWQKVWKKPLKLQRTKKCVLKMWPKKFSQSISFPLKIGDIKRKKKEFMRIIYYYYISLEFAWETHLQRCSQYEKIIFHIQE